MSVVHALDEVGRSEEHAPKALFDLHVAYPYLIKKDQSSEILTDPFLLFTPSQHEVVLNQEDVHLLPKGPELEGRVGKLFKIVNHSSPYGVAVDIPYTGQIIFVGFDDTGPVPVTPEVSGASDVFIIPDSYSGI